MENQVLEKKQTPVVLSLVTLLFVASCATVPGGADGEVPEAPPRLPAPAPPTLSGASVPEAYLVFGGVGLVPPAGVEVIPAPGTSGERLLRFEGEDLVAEILILPDREAQNLAAFLADQSLAGEIAEGSYTGVNALPWQLVSGWRRRNGDEAFSAETHALSPLEGGGTLHFWAAGSEAATRSLMDAILPTLLVFSQDRNARWRGYTGFAALSNRARWVGDRTLNDVNGLLFRASSPEGDAYTVWVFDGELEGDQTDLTALLGSGDVALAQPLVPGVRLGGEIDSREAETRALSTPWGAGLFALWRRPSGRPVSVMLVPVEGDNAGDEQSASTQKGYAELIGFFDREIEPILFLGEPVR